jgi:RimJ/RimL family protein N-acetyltransferase
VEVLLETDRLVLRRFTEADVDNLVELDADPQVMRYINGGPATERAEVANDILPRFLWYYESFVPYGFWACVEKATGAFIGWFHLRPMPETGVADQPELGYRLRRQSWGKGYATEGSRALIDMAFRDFGASRVFAETMAVNLGSRRVMEKAGMRLVREFQADWPVQIDGDEHGDVEYAITRDEWERANRPPAAGRDGT